MSTSNVRDIECLAEFRLALINLASNWNNSAQEIRTAVHRIDAYFQSERPAYWRHQTQLAERALSEAKDNLSRLRSQIRPGQAPPATEAAQRVIVLERRLRMCQEKERLAKTWSIEMSQQCDQLLGPLADVTEHCQTHIPEAARELGVLVDRLRAYAETRTAGLDSNVDSSTE